MWTQASYRLLMLVAAAVYTAWWFAVEWLLPEAFNPAGSRAAVVGTLLGAALLTYLSPTLYRHGATLYAFCACVLTAHYYYLFDKNAADLNWITGSYVTIIAIGVTLDGMRTLAFYGVFVLVAAYAVTTRHAIGPISMPGTLTVVVLVMITGYLRRQMDVERRLRAKAESDKAAAAAANRAQMQFLSNINHELRTPLSAIMGFADLIEQDPELTDDARGFAKRISSNGRALATMIEHILVLTEMGVVTEPKLTAIDVRQVVSTRLDKDRAELSGRGVQLTQSFDEGVPASLFTDPDLFRYVLDTVMDNAVKFTRTGRIDVRVAMAGSPPTRLEIAVQDSGPGIPASEWETVFEPFAHAQTDRERPQRGAGIGLTVARKLARLLDGDVSIAQSTPGRGTTVVISLPAGSL